MLQQTHSFSIENNINEITGQPFGAKYRGVFNIRRPSLYDKTMAAQKEAAERNAFGVVNPGQIPNGLEMGAFIFHLVTTIATSPVPEWFDRAKIFDSEDESAIYEVYQEVKKYQNSFRAGNGSGAGTGEGGNTQVLVQTALQTDTN